MVSSTLCPAMHILVSQNVYGRAEGIADHYWPWAVFLTVHVAFVEAILSSILYICHWTETPYFCCKGHYTI